MASKIAALAMTLMLVVVGIAGGCKNSTQFLAPPYLPAPYYNCIETYPQELVHAYFAGYGEIWGPIQNYNNKVFVFKDNPLDEYVIRELDEGWLWLDLIKCPLANPEAMQYFKVGDKFDLVGLNLGPEDLKTPGLTFKDCYIMRCGSVKLPADGTGGAVGPGY